MSFVTLPLDLSKFATEIGLSDERAVQFLRVERCEDNVKKMRLQQRRMDGH